MIYLIASLVIFLPLLWGSWRGYALHWLLWQMALSTTLVGIMSLAYIYLHARWLENSDIGLQHNYFVVPDLIWTKSFAVIVIPLGGILWAQSRWARALWPSLQKTAIWCIAGGALVPLLGYAAFDLGVIVQTNLMMTVNFGRTINMGALTVALLGAGCLLVLPLTALVFRRR